MNIENLITEILLKIFSYLDLQDLAALRRTCKRFYEIIDVWALTILPQEFIYVTKQENLKFINRCNRKLKSFEKIRISTNWKTGRFREKNLLFSKSRILPWLHLQQKFLWISSTNRVLAYHRNNYNGIDIHQIPYMIKSKSNSDVYRFALKDDYILAGQVDGSLWLWSKESRNFLFDQAACHESDINSCDLCNDILVSGSNDNTIKIWRRPKEYISVQPEMLNSFEACDRIWSVTLCEENNSLLGIGTSGNTSLSVISIYDTSANKYLTQYNTEKLGAGILDLKWETASIIWSCGYDGFLRKWDLRTEKCVQEFMDPCNSTIYCFHLDYFNSMVTGTQTNGRAVLWDQRVQKYLQMYFMDCCKRCNQSSPIYSLSFDAEFLFAHTDKHVNVLNFSIFNGVQKDYSGLFDRSTNLITG